MTDLVETPPRRRRHVAAAVVGNALEFYDFITYSFFAIQIGHAFFPKGGEFASLMLSLATFGAGFITRPIGGIVIGAFADRVGRRSAMLLSFTLMGLSIIFLALIPPYSVIGIAAPILAVLARMSQGFALGGEVGPNTAYLLEVAGPKQRGLYVSWQAASQTIASVTGSLVGLSLTWILSPAALDTYGWRIAFLLGAITLPVGFLLRRAMPETLHTPEDGPKASSGQTARAIFWDNRRIIGLGVVVLAGGTISTYVTNYMTTYAQHTLHMKPGVSFAATMIPNAIGLFSSLYGGWLSDRIGRRPVMLVSRGLAMIVTLPIFYWIVATHSAWALLGGLGLLAFVGGAGQAVFYVSLSETLPKPVRGRVFATLYATAIAVFGGTTQPMITWLIQVTGDPMAPGWYLMGATAASLVAIALILESAPVKLKTPALPDEGALGAV